VTPRAWVRGPVLRVRSPVGEVRWEAEGGFHVRTYSCVGPVARRACVTSWCDEMTVVLTGELTLHMGPFQQEIRVLAGEGCVILRGTPHEWTATAGTQFVVHASQLNGDAILGVRPISLRVLTRDTLRRIEAHTRGAGVLRDSARALHTAVGRAATDAIGLERCHTTVRMEHIKSVLDRRYREPVRLGELAVAHGLEAGYVSRAFRKNFGFTPKGYLQSLREEEFFKRVLEGERVVSRAARQAGIADYPTFCREVRAAYGHPPTELFQWAPEPTGACRGRSVGVTRTP